MEILGKIFSRDNIVILLLIVTSILALFGIPQQFGVTSEQLILGLLGIIALDTLIVRLGYLDRIEANIENLQSGLEAQGTASDVFLKREQLTPFTEWLENHKEIWLAGFSLFTLTDIFGQQMNLALQKGVKIRVIVVDPKEDLVWNVASRMRVSYQDAETLQQIAHNGLKRFNVIASKSPANSIDIRTINFYLNHSFIVGLGESSTDKLMIDFYDYQVSSGERRHVVFRKKNESELFEHHKSQYLKIWQAANELT